MIKDDIYALLQPVLVHLGYELWGIEYLPSGRHSLLRVYIDKADGIQITDCEIVSKRISAILDVEDPISSNYSLEVSSPGIPRSLFTKEQYQRYIGAPLHLKLHIAIENRKKLTGNLISVEEDHILLQIEEGQKAIPFSQIIKAHLISE